MVVAVVGFHEVRAEGFIQQYDIRAWKMDGDGAVTLFLNPGDLVERDTALLVFKKAGGVWGSTHRGALAPCGDSKNGVGLYRILTFLF